MEAKKPSPLSVREQFMQQIEDRILSGQWKVGEKLPPARALCDLYGVSLTVVNAGVSELVTRGFLTVRPRQGTFVADYRENGSAETLMSLLRHNGGRLAPEDVRAFCETRIALDPVVAELAIDRSSNEQFRQLGEKAEKVAGAENAEELCIAVTEFYHRLYQMSGNMIFSLLFHSTMEPQQLMYRQFADKNGMTVLTEHVRAVYELLRDRDTEGAKRRILEDLQLPLNGSTAII